VLGRIVSFHDEVAQKALRDGNSTDDFAAAAQKHANASWLYGIVAALVYYFFGWLWALPLCSVSAIT